MGGDGCSVVLQFGQVDVLREYLDIGKYHGGTHVAVGDSEALRPIGLRIDLGHIGHKATQGDVFDAQ